MPRIFAFVIAGFFATAALAQEAEAPSAVELWQEDPMRVFDAGEVDLKDFEWLARPLVIFAGSENDPRLRQQLELLAKRPDALIEREVVIITDTDPDTLSPLRERLRPRDFMLVIMGKDGEVELRKPAPWPAREISRSIDKMPLRQQEIDAQRGI
ncbi:DUF4174 domain-containing protein [Salibaculum sp.]|uniref:DUF4174 domain-containing protein n=1 Tax=Salibaculum sp. TaxID=2855480 RepID=UPI002B4934DE|nr:DUF4174 domain-containing protein [Salibaculum sp.]HKL70631.1 DUF4174 domain-containing protein [Salibaculum sp.]